MFDRILNATLPEEKLSTIGVTQRILELLLRLNSLDLDQTHIPEYEILE